MRPHAPTPGLLRSGISSRLRISYIWQCASSGLGAFGKAHRYIHGGAFRRQSERKKETAWPHRRSITPKAKSKVSTSSRPCLTQTGAGYWLTLFPAWPGAFDARGYAVVSAMQPFGARDYAYFLLMPERWEAAWASVRKRFAFDQAADRFCCAKPFC